MASYTLATSIGPDTTSIDLTPVYALTGSAYPGRLTCESEAMYVTGGAGTSTISVLRGQDGTAAVAHASGTTVADANLGAAVAQTVSLLGPAHIAFGDIGATPTATGFVIPTSALVVKAFAMLSADGSADAGSKVQLGLYPSNDLSNGTILATYDMYDGYVSPGSFAQVEQGILNSSDPSQVSVNVPRSAVALTECTIGVTGTGAFANGILDVYALIATPS